MISGHFALSRHQEGTRTSCIVLRSDLPPAIPGPTLMSQMQIEIQFGRGAGALTATEQAARLASARVERRIGRLLSPRVKLKFR